eukprot:405065-Amphidinium_carterae.1
MGEKRDAASEGACVDSQREYLTTIKRTSSFRNCGSCKMSKSRWVSEKRELDHVAATSRTYREITKSGNQSPRPCPEALWRLQFYCLRTVGTGNPHVAIVPLAMLRNELWSTSLRSRTLGFMESVAFTEIPSDPSFRSLPLLLREEGSSSNVGMCC